MRLAALLRWDLVLIARGEAAHVAIAVVALASSGLVAAGILILAIWSPFTLMPSFATRADPNVDTLASVLGQYRGGVAFLVLLLWLLAVATAVGPAFAAGSIVRDRRVGRLDRILLDTGRSDLVVVGKLFTGLVPLLMVVLVAGPATSFAWLIGGITAPDAIAEAVTLALLVVLIASVGLFCSAIATTETAAVLLSYCALSLIFWVPIFGAAALSARGWDGVANAVASIDPAVALLAGQPNLMRSVLHLAPSTLPAPPVVWTIAAPIKLSVSVWAADAVLYAVVAAVLVWLSGVILEPYHPLKLWRARALVEARG